MRLYLFESNDIESMFFELSFNHSSSFIVGFVYRPPNVSSSWINLFSDQLQNVFDLYQEVYLLGDFNIQFTSTGDCSSNKWTQCMLTFGLTQLVHTPTRITAKTSSIIDHVYTTHPENVSNVDVQPISMSDHYPISFVRRLTSKDIIGGIHKTITYRSFQCLNETIFKSDLSMSSLYHCEFISDPNSSLDHFYSVLNQTLNKHVPLKIKRVRRVHQPEWFNNEIKEAIRQRDNYHHNNDFKNYKTWRNRVTNLIKRSKRNYFNSAIEKNKDSKHIWKQIKKISGQEHVGKFVLPPKLEVGDSIITGSDDIVNAFNTHFVNISNIIDKTSFDPAYFSILESNLNKTLGNK